MATKLDHLSERAPDWARVARLLRMWTDPAARLGSRIPLVWLEFDDMKHASGRIPNPCFHACVEPEYLRQGGAAAPSDVGADAHREVLASTFEVLLGHALPARISQPLRACFERLPPPGRMIHVSAMLARTPAAIKLYGCVPVQHLESYLQEIGWPGAVDDLRGMLDSFCSPSTIDHMIYFDLAFEEHLTPSIGIVFSQLQLDAAGNRDPRRQVLMEGLVRAGLCAPHKRDASMQWPGSDRVRYSGSSAPTRLRRWLDIKVSCHPERSASAKAYLGFMPVFSLF